MFPGVRNNNKPTLAPMRYEAIIWTNYVILVLSCPTRPRYLNIFCRLYALYLRTFMQTAGIWNFEQNEILVPVAPFTNMV